MNYIWCYHVGHPVMKQGHAFHPGIFQTSSLFEYMHKKQYTLHSNILQIYNAFKLDKAVSHIQAWGILVPWPMPPALEVPDHQGSSYIDFFFHSCKILFGKFYSRKYNSERNLLGARWENQTSKYTLFLSVYHFLIVSLRILAWSKKETKPKLL